MIAWSPKTGTFLFRGVRLVLCKLLPGECVLHSEIGLKGASHLDVLQAGPMLRGVPAALLVVVRDPIRWMVSSFSYFGKRGAEFAGARDWDPDCEDVGGAQRSREERSVVAEVRADARFRHLPAWRARETYGQFVGRLSLRDGVLVEMARHMLHLQVRGSTTHAAPAGKRLDSPPRDTS